MIPRTVFNTQSTRLAVENVLCDMRKAIDSDLFSHENRQKNIRTLAALGILWSDAKDEIYTLTYDDYVKGPETDRDNPPSDKYWFFKKYIFRRVVYIKFKVEYQKDGQVWVKSFHIDE